MNVLCFEDLHAAGSGRKLLRPVGEVRVGTEEEGLLHQVSVGVVDVSAF